LGVDEPLYGLVAGNESREQDDEHNDHPRQVFDPPVAEREASARAKARQREGDAQRHGGRRVAEVVDSVRQQGDAAGEQDHASLHEAVTNRATKDHFTAQMPRSEVLWRDLPRRGCGHAPVVVVRVFFIVVGAIEAILLPTWVCSPECLEGEFSEVQRLAVERRNVRRVISSSCSQPSPTKE
jgi:hypothetical protein